MRPQVNGSESVFDGHELDQGSGERVEVALGSATDGQGSRDSGGAEHASQLMQQSEADFASQSFLVDIESGTSPELSHLVEGRCDQVIAESGDGESVEEQLDEDATARRFSSLNHGLEKRRSSFLKRSGFVVVEIGESEEFGLR